MVSVSIFSRPPKILPKNGSLNGSRSERCFEEALFAWRNIWGILKEPGRSGVSRYDFRYLWILTPFSTALLEENSFLSPDSSILRLSFISSNWGISWKSL